MSGATVATRPIAHWLRQTLAADTTVAAAVGTRIYDKVTPPNADTWPVVVYSFMSGKDIAAVGPFTIAADCIYLVKGIDKSRSYGLLEPLLQAVCDALDGASGTPSGGGEVFTCYRDTHVEYSEVTPDGEVFQHLGHTYRIIAR